jgi:hypothetical protein
MIFISGVTRLNKSVADDSDYGQKAMQVPLPGSRLVASGAKSRFRTTGGERVGLAVLAAVSGTAGWVACSLWHEFQHVTLPAAVPAAVSVEPQTSVTMAVPPQFVTMLGDGYVSVHVDNAPIVWLLQEFERHGVPLSIAAPASPRDFAGSTPLAFGGPDASEPDPADQAHLVDALRGGTEGDQYDSLTQALQLGIDLPADLLRQAFETGPSERVRLLAFTTYLDNTASDVESVREALASGTVNTSAAVQAEARKRLEEFERYQELIAATPPQGDP